MECAANRIGSAEELAREHLVHDSHLWRRERVALIEIASGHDTRSHRAEVAWAGSIEKSLLAARCGCHVGTNRVIPTTAAHGREPDLSHGKDTRESRQPLGQLTI